MKKIKGLLLFGILSALFSACFGYENFNRAFGTYTDSVGSKNFYTSFSLSNDNVVNNGVGNENGNVLPLNQSFSTNQSFYPQESRYLFYESRTINHLFDSFGGDARVTSRNIGGFTVPGTSPSDNFIINGTGNVLDFNYLHLFYSQSSLFDDYFFLTSSFLYNMSGSFLDIPGGLSRKKVLPGLNVSYSSISVPNEYGDYPDDYFQFSFIPEDGFQDGGLYNLTGVIVLHFNTYSDNYLTGTNTIVLFKDDSNIYYNLYNEYTDSLSTLSSITPISKGVLYSYGGGNGFNDFKNMVFDSGLMFEVSGSPSNGLIFKSIDKQFVDGHLYNQYYFTFTENNGVLDWGDFINGAGGNNDFGASYNSIPFSSLYYQCLGPTYNTPDGLPPAFCLNPDGTLINPSDYQNCFYNTTLSGGELIGHYFCDLGGYIQEMDWVSEGSGGYFSICSSGDCGNYLVSGPSFINIGTGISLSTGLIEDMFTNITGWIAKCPFTYTDFQLGQNFGLLKYFRSIGFDFDPFVLINCVVAGFSDGRHTITNKAGLSFLTSPLISGDTEQHRSLYTFLDFILILGILGIVAFLKKIF